jgi:hypothetical protein
MSDDRKYVRVYYSIIDDERFQMVYPDPATLGTWLRLLLLADAMWPSSSPLPYGISRKCLDVLVKAGIIELLSNRHYKIHGLEPERQRRSEAGRVGGLASGRSRTVERSFNGLTNGIEPRRAETSKAETSRAEQIATVPFRDLVKDFPK